MTTPTPALQNKVPPQNLEAEQSTLGSMMLEPGALEKGLEILGAEDFYRPVHEEIFNALQLLCRQNEAVDLITLQEELRRRGKLEDCGGTEYLMALVDSVPTAANIEYYARIVKDKAVLRKMIAAGAKMIAMAQNEEDEVDCLLETAERLVFDVAQKRSSMDMVRMKDAYEELYSELPKMAQNYGVPIGLSPLAQQCIGMVPGELIVVGARPRIGKSALAFDLLMEAARKGYPGAIISCEMTAQQFAMREIAKNSNVHVRQMFTGNLNENHYSRIANAIAQVYDLPVYYVNAVGWTIGQIQSACRRLVASGVKVIAIDHIQRVKPDNVRASRHVQIGQISSGCKDIALDLKVPVLALCQLNREADKRGVDARPTLADLKESGDIEADADVVWLLWRPTSADDQRSMEVTEAEIIVAKNRMLPEGVVKCGYHGRLFKFVSRSEMSEPGQKSGQKALTGA